MTQLTNLKLDSIDNWLILTSQPLSIEERRVLGAAWREAKPLMQPGAVEAFTEWLSNETEHGSHAANNFNTLSPVLFSSHKEVPWTKLEFLLEVAFESPVFLDSNGGPRRALVQLANLFKAREPFDETESLIRLRMMLQFMEKFSASHWDRLNDFSTHNPRVSPFEYAIEISPDLMGLWEALRFMDADYPYFKQVLVDRLEQVKPAEHSSIDIPDSFTGL